MSPTGVRALRESRQLELTWPDQRVDALPFKRLRCECPCAGCVNEMTGVRTLDPAMIPEDVAPVQLSLSGNYALKISWTDGHNTGIYSWDLLRRLGGVVHEG